MAPPLYERLRSHQDDRVIEDNRHSVDYRKEYGSLHPGYNTTTNLRERHTIPERQSYQMVMAPAGPRDRQGSRRPLSPVTSFLQQIPLGSTQFSRPTNSLLEDRDENRHGRFTKPQEENYGREIHRSTPISRSTPGTTLKRSALSPSQLSEREDATKRQRTRTTDDDSSSKPVASAKSITDVEKVIEPKDARASYQLKEPQRMQDAGLAGKLQDASSSIPWL